MRDSVITAEQMLLCSGFCNLVLKTGPDASVLIAISEKLTFVASIKYTLKNVDWVNF